MKFIKSSYDYIFAILITFVVFDFKIANIVLGLLVLLYLIDFKNSKKFTIQKIKPSLWSYLIFLLLMVVGGIVENTWDEKRIEFYILLPIVWILGTKVRNTTLLLNTYVISLLGIVILGCYHQLDYFISSSDFDMAVGNKVNEVLLIERPYLGFMCVLGVLIVLHLMKCTSKRLLWIPLGIFLLYPLLISARMAILSLLVIVFCYLLTYTSIPLRIKVSSLLVGMVLLGGMYQFNQAFRDRIKLDRLDFNDTESIKNADPRVIIWTCSSQLFNSSSTAQKWLGIHNAKSLEESMVACYSNDSTNLDRKNYFVSERFNTHNQFIDFVLIGGIVVAAIFLSFIGLLLYENRGIALLSVIALLMFMLVENVFARQMGIYLSGIVWVMLPMLQRQKNNYRSLF